MFNVFTLGMIALASIPSSQATSLEHWDTPKLTKESKWVHIGEITSMWSSWDPQRRMVYTYVKMRVNETLKGGQATEVLIRQPGGKANGYGMVVHGMASFSRGEKALVFLKEDDDGAPSIVGMAQGKFRIFRNQTGEEVATFRAPSRVEFFTRGEQGKIRHLVSSQVERRIPIRDLVHEIRSSVQTEGSVSY